MATKTTQGLVSGTLTGTTNLGPLTTTFRAPASCSTPLLSCSTVESSQKCDIFWGDVKCGSDAKVVAATECLPSGVYDDWYSTKLPVFSPGLACPAGETSACTWKTAGVTTIGCCPAGYGCDENAMQSCTSLLPTGSSVSTLYYCNKRTTMSRVVTNVVYTEASSYRTLEVWDGSSLLVSQTGLQGVLQVHLVVPTADASSFEVQGTTLTSKISSETTQSPSTSPSSATDALASPKSNDGASGLPTSTKIAIGVTIPLIALLAIALGCIFYFRRARRQRATDIQAPTSPGAPTSLTSPNAPNTSTGYGPDLAAANAGSYASFQPHPVPMSQSPNLQHWSPQASQMSNLPYWSPQSPVPTPVKYAQNVGPSEMSGRMVELEGSRRS